jgi:cell shape-determining protein MreC
MEVRTSGYGGVFPPNISVGQILDSRPAEYGQATVARVKLAANLNALQEVWVILP